MEEPAEEVRLQNGQKLSTEDFQLLQVVSQDDTDGQVASLCRDCPGASRVSTLTSAPSYRTARLIPVRIDCLVGWKCCQASSSRAIIAECFSAPHVASPIGILKVQFGMILASWITAYSSNSPLKILANRISFRTTRCLQPVDLVNHIHLCLLEDSELRWKLGTLKIFGW